MTSGHLLGCMLALIATGLYATSTLLTKPASDRVKTDLGFLISVFVNAMSAFCIALTQIAFRSTELDIRFNAVFAFLVAGFFSTYLGRWFFFESVVRLGAAKASAYQLSAPLFAVVIGWVALRESIDLFTLSTMLLAILGLICIMWQKDKSASSVAPPLQSGWRALVSSPVALGVVSAAAYAMGNILRGYGVRSWNEPVIGAGLGALTGLTLQLVTGNTARTLLSRLKQADRRGLLLYVLIGLAGIGAQILSIASMRYLPVAIVSLITMCAPVPIFIFSYLVFGDRRGINPRGITGLAVTLAAVGLIILRPLL
jgi:drug/metabolite transporter (DMT)-like permease